MGCGGIRSGLIVLFSLSTSVLSGCNHERHENGVSVLNHSSTNKQVADQLYRLSEQVMLSVPFPEDNSQLLASLRSALAGSDWSINPDVAAFLESTAAVNSYLIANTDSQSVKEADQRDITRFQFDASGSYEEAGLLYMKANAAARTLTVNDAQSRATNVYALTKRNTFDYSQFRELREKSNRSYGAMLADLRQMKFGRLLHRDELCAKQWDWRWDSNSATIGFEFKMDGTFEAKITPDSRSSAPETLLVDKGFGTWELDDDALTVVMTHVYVFGIRKEHYVTFIDGREIVDFDLRQILLNGPEDNRLTAGK